MKRFIWAVCIMLSIISAKAQDYYDPDDYGFDVEEGIYLTGNQWHTDGYSYLEANNNRFLVVAGNNRFYRILPRPDIGRMQLRFGDVIISFRPFFYLDCLGWYLAGRHHNYFLYPDGRWCLLDFRPVYYNYHYNIGGLRHINFYHWHFWHGRSHRDYHGPMYRPPRHYHKPAPVYHRRQPQPPPQRHIPHRTPNYRHDPPRQNKNYRPESPRQDRNYRRDQPHQNRRSEASRRSDRNSHSSHERRNHR